jgi:hypothetical protein
MNRGIIHKLLSKARKYLKKMKVLGKKVIKGLGGDSTKNSYDNICSSLVGSQLIYGGCLAVW